MSEEVPTGIVDTDSSAIREIRIEAQKTTEKEIHEGIFKGVPFCERLVICREKLFGQLENVKGDKPTEFRKKTTSKMVWNLFHTGLIPKELEFPHPYDVPRFINFLGNLVDKSAAFIQKEKDRDQDVTVMAERLASITFAIGTLIHPHIDGNGQTMKTMALSYLDEFSHNKYGQSTFPERQGKMDNNSLRINSSAELVKTRDTNIARVDEITNDPDMAMLLEVQSCPSPTEPSLDSEKKVAEYQERKLNWAKRSLERINKTEVPGEDPSQTLTNITRTASDAVSEKGISSLMVDFSKNTALTLFVLYLTTTSRGEIWIENYIKTGKTIPNESVFKTVKWVEPLAQKIFLEVEREIKRLLKPR